VIARERNEKEREALKEMDIDFPGYQASVMYNVGSRQGRPEKGEKTKRRKRVVRRQRTA
jgi:hypothetical protein